MSDMRLSFMETDHSVTESVRLNVCVAIHSSTDGPFPESRTNIPPAKSQTFSAVMPHGPRDPGPPIAPACPIVALLDFSVARVCNGLRPPAGKSPALLIR